MRQISVGANLTANVKTTLYKVPTGYYALWNLCYIVNHTGQNKTVDVFWFDFSLNTEIRFLDNSPLSPGQFIKFNDGSYVVLEENDEIRVMSEIGSDMSIINTLELIRKP